MKYVVKGIGLGLSLNLTNRICTFLFCSHQDVSPALFSFLLFAWVTTVFLVSDTIPHLLLCGFTGLFIMFYGEIFVLRGAFGEFQTLPIYVYGMFGSIAAIGIAVVLTLRHFSLSSFLTDNGTILSKNSKGKLLLYLLFSAIGFSYLVLPEHAGISVPIFVVLQFFFLWFLVPNRKKLVWMIPIFLLSLNSFLSANPIWKPWNFLICLLLYSCMFLEISFRNDTFSFLSGALLSISSSLRRIALPFRWFLELNQKNASLIKRIFLSLLLAIPAVIVLTIILSGADLVFQVKTHSFFNHLMGFIQIRLIFKCLCGLAMGFLLFGILYQSHTCNIKPATPTFRLKGDLLIINILLSSILLVYTLFVIVQFRYLFAGATLPQGLTYTAYARKGFFELLALTGVNIAIILFVTRLTRLQQGKWSLLSKGLCHYLCVVTIVLLISSFYRMLLYANDDGLTRLRLFVLGFLVFEAIGLLITFFYIQKSNFTVMPVYLALALTYYIVLNLAPTDYIIAKNQVDRFLREERTDVDYVFTLSSDAIPALEYLMENTDHPDLQKRAEQFIHIQSSSEIPVRWQRYRLSPKQKK